MSQQYTNLNQLLIDTIVETKQGIAKGVDVVMEQMPEVTNQLLRWQFWQATTMAIFLLALTIVAAFAWRRLFKWEDPGGYTDAYECGRPIGLISIPMIAAITGGFAIEQALAAIKISLAPKVYLIEYCAALMK